MRLTANHLLNSLSSPVRQELVDHSRHVSLAVNDILSTPARQPSFAYFLTGGVASVVVTGLNGAVVDVETIGSEGVVGATYLLGANLVSSLCVMRLGGHALRIPIAMLWQMFLRSAELHRRVLAFVQVQNAMLAQIAACNRMHDVERRLARILLTLRDRGGVSTILLTQEALAEMLGTQRSTVCLAAAELQARGLIEYTRGRLKIVEELRLEQAACECYAVTRSLLAGLYPQAGHPPLLQSRQFSALGEVS